MGDYAREPPTNPAYGLPRKIANYGKKC